MIGFIGGTGNQGRALALRLSAFGEEVILGSRSMEKAEITVSKIKKEKKGLKIKPGTNEEAARKAEIVFVTLPYGGMKEALMPLALHLRGKIVVDVTNPFTNGDVHDMSFNRDRGISASEELQALLSESRVVCAFKNVSSNIISHIDEEVEAASIVCSDFKDAKQRIIRLSEKIEIPSVDGGGLENALLCELLTRFLLQLNKRYKTETGIKIVYHHG